MERSSEGVSQVVVEKAGTVVEIWVQPTGLEIEMGPTLWLGRQTLNGEVVEEQPNWKDGAFVGKLI